MKRAKYISNGTITYKIVGDQGPQGPQGPKGDTGKSAYQIAVDNGFVGTESEWLASLNVDISDLDNAVFNIEQGYVLVTDDVITLSNMGITKISNTSFTIETQNGHTIKGYKVKAGENIRIRCMTFNNYQGYGYVWSTTENTPPLWNGNNSQPMLSALDYDYLCGNTQASWVDYTLDLEVPSDAKMIWVRTQAGEPKLYKNMPVKTSKIPTKTSQLENDSNFVVVDDKLPVICFDFDETLNDSRYTILKQYGLTATTTQNQQSGFMKWLVKNGFDISLYVAKRDGKYTSDADIETWKTAIQSSLTELESWGIYNPVLYSCGGHLGGYSLDEALKSFNFRYQRCIYGFNQDGSYYYLHANNNRAENFQVCPYLMNDLAGNGGAEKIINVINTDISNGNQLIMLMMHTYSSEPNMTEEIFETVVSHVKSLVDSGQALCMNMRQFYAYYYPHNAKEDDYNRLMASVVKSSIN